MISQLTIEEVLAKHPGTPIPRNEEARRQWAIWRAIMDRIISNPHYRYDDPLKWPLIKQTIFVSEMMGHFNELVYKVSTRRDYYTR